MAVVAHQQADGEHVGQQGDGPADAPVLDEVIQRIEHEKRVHGADLFFDELDDLLKALARGDEIVDHQRDIGFAGAGALAVKDVHLLFRHILLRELNAQRGRVVRAGELGGQRDDEAVALRGADILGVQVGGRAGGADGVFARLHGGQIRRNIDRAVVHVMRIVYGNGQRRDLRLRFFEQLGGEITTAICKNGHTRASQ